MARSLLLVVVGITLCACLAQGVDLPGTTETPLQTWRSRSIGERVAACVYYSEMLVGEPIGEVSIDDLTFSNPNTLCKNDLSGGGEGVIGGMQWSMLFTKETCPAIRDDMSGGGKDSVSSRNLDCLQSRLRSRCVEVPADGDMLPILYERCPPLLVCRKFMAHDANVHYLNHPLLCESDMDAENEFESSIPEVLYQFIRGYKALLLQESGRDKEKKAFMKAIVVLQKALKKPRSNLFKSLFQPLVNALKKVTLDLGSDCVGELLGGDSFAATRVLLGCQKPNIDGVLEACKPPKPSKWSRKFSGFTYSREASFELGGPIKDYWSKESKGPSSPFYSHLSSTAEKICKYVPRQLRVEMNLEDKLVDELMNYEFVSNVEFVKDPLFADVILGNQNSPLFVSNENSNSDVYIHSHNAESGELDDTSTPLVDGTPSREDTGVEDDAPSPLSADDLNKGDLKAEAPPSLPPRDYETPDAAKRPPPPPPEEEEGPKRPAFLKDIENLKAKASPTAPPPPPPDWKPPRNHDDPASDEQPAVPLQPLIGKQDDPNKRPVQPPPPSSDGNSGGIPFGANALKDQWAAIRAKAEKKAAEAAENPSRDESQDKKPPSDGLLGMLLQNWKDPIDNGSDDEASESDDDGSGWDDDDDDGYGYSPPVTSDVSESRPSGGVPLPKESTRVHDPRDDVKEDDVGEGKLNDHEKPKAKPTGASISEPTSDQSEDMQDKINKRLRQIRLATHGNGDGSDDEESESWDD